jgi:hypothetical protein
MDKQFETTPKAQKNNKRIEKFYLYRFGFFIFGLNSSKFSCTRWRACGVSAPHLGRTTG